MTSPLGLESGVVRLAEYDAQWTVLFEAEAERLRAAVAPLQLALEHTGSTAVPGLCAKPVLDILAGYRDQARLGRYLSALTAAGYVHRGDQEIPGREFFRRGTPRAYHLHLTQEGSSFWREHLAFRDSLRADPAVRDAYARLKRDLAARHPTDRESYIEAKGPFVQEVLQRWARTLRAAALLFDMDGVLLDSRPVVERTWRRWAARHGRSAEPMLKIAHGRRTSDTLRATAPELATREEVAWLDAAELEDFDGIVAIPGARALLSSLPPSQWTVVTSAGRELAERRLAIVGIGLPRHAVTSEDVERGKPAPDGYLLAAARLGVRAEECLVVEDAPPGVQAGRAAGARVIALTTTHPPEALGDADHVVPDLLSLRVTPDAGGLEVAITGRGKQ